MTDPHQLQNHNGDRAGRFRQHGNVFQNLIRTAVAAAVALVGVQAAPVAATETATSFQGPAQADKEYRALFLSWKRLDRFDQVTVSVPSQRPLVDVEFSSGFGVRSDPFRGAAAMHAGVDMRGPVGTPIYATADGYVGRAGWSNGYGNLVELEHGKGIETRYGHLSKILVQPGQRVKRGDLIARMGSTGRSTGSHLHYEVRIDGRAVNPIPFLQTSDYLVQITNNKVAVGGPDN